MVSAGYGCARYYYRCYYYHYFQRKVFQIGPKEEVRVRVVKVS